MMLSRFLDTTNIIPDPEPNYRYPFVLLINKLCEQFLNLYSLVFYPGSGMFYLGSLNFSFRIPHPDPKSFNTGYYCK
jgi:hypothetical protein